MTESLDSPNIAVSSEIGVNATSSILPSGQTGEALFSRAQIAAEFLQQRIAKPVDLAIVLGSGLGALAETLRDPLVIPYTDIPGFARSTVEGHSGRLVVGQFADGEQQRTVAAMQGRFHYYEGYELADVTLPIRAFALAGIRKLILTNAAGGVNPALAQGDLMLIQDHINLMMNSPLRGTHDARLGARFPDMTTVYDPAWRTQAKDSAHELGIKLQEGIYLALQGPNYETPSEVRMARLLGGDAVGMSTVPEAIVARQMGMQVLGISLITNVAAGVNNDEPINHAEVMEMGALKSAQFIQLLQHIMVRL